MKTAVEQIFEQHDKHFDKMKFLRWLSSNRRVMKKIETSIAQSYAKDCIQNEKEGRPFILFQDWVKMEVNKPEFASQHNYEFGELWYEEMTSSYDSKYDKTELLRLEHYKWYMIDNDELVETDPTCFEKEDPIIYITTTPTTPTNTEFQIWRNDKLFWNDFGMKAVELTSVPQLAEHILRQLL